jgi:hypothetical protein
MPLRNQNENMAHNFVKYDRTQTSKEKFLDNEWLHINEETANKKIISCDKMT